MVKITRWTYKRVISVERFGNVQVEAVGEVEDGEDPDDAWDALRRDVDLKALERKMRIEGTIESDDDEPSGYMPARAQQFKQGGINASQINSGPVTRFSPNTGGNLAQRLQAQGASAPTMQQRINPASPQYDPDAEGDSVAAARLTMQQRARSAASKIAIPQDGRLQIDLGSQGALLRLYDGDDTEIETRPIPVEVAKAYMADHGDGDLSMDTSGNVTYRTRDDIRAARAKTDYLKQAINAGEDLYVPAFGGIRIDRAPTPTATLLSDDGEELQSIGISLATAELIEDDDAKGAFVIRHGRYVYEPSGYVAPREVAGWLQLHRSAGVAELEYRDYDPPRPRKQLAAGFAQIAIDRDLLVGRYGLPGLKFANDDEAAFWRAHDLYAASQESAGEIDGETIPCSECGGRGYADTLRNKSMTEAELAAHGGDLCERCEGSGELYRCPTCGGSGDKTGISWTDAMLNALEGCREISAGCDHCYAAQVALRFGGPGQHYEGLAVADGAGGARWTGQIKMNPHKLDQALRWGRGRRIFVNSMSDLFYARVPVRFIDQHFAAFALSQRHQYQILTKRPDRAERYLNDPETPRRVAKAARAILTSGDHPRRDYLDRDPSLLDHDTPLTWPLANVWMGTSIESQAVAHRAGDLNRCMAAVRFISAEPLIGALSLDGYYSGLHWVIVGGESGKQHRPMDPDWARALRDECAAAGVAFFFKQSAGPKSGTGTLLDGREHHAFPAALPG